MPMHHFKKSVKALLGSHIDSGKHNQIKEAKEDIDYKVDKILKLNKDEESEGKDENSPQNSQTEPLLALIKEFRDQYHTLYARYDDITEKLGNKVLSKHDKDNSSASSSSSDSESEYSLNGNGRKNGRLSDSLKLELEAEHQELDELREKFTTTNEENKALRSRLQEVETVAEELKIGIGRLDEEKAKLAAENDDLSLKLDNLYNEKGNLILELETNRRAIEVGEKTMADLKTTADDAVAELETVINLLASTQQEIAALRNSQNMGTEENSSLSKQISELSDELNQAKSTIHEMIAESSQNKEKLADREIILSTLTVAHETHKNEASSQITNLSAQVQSLEVGLKSLSKHKTELNADLDRKVEEIKQLTDQKSKLLTQVTELEQMSNEKGEEIDGLTKKLEENEFSSAARIQDLAGPVESLSLEVENLCSKKAELEEQLKQKSVEADDQVKNLGDQIDLMRNELDSVSKQKSVLEEQLESRIIDINQLKEENEIMQKKFEDRENEASAQILCLTEQTNLSQARNSELQELLESMTNQASDQLKKITTLTAELESPSNQLGQTIESKERVIVDLEKQVDILREDLETKVDELSSVTEDIHNIEVTLGLRNQKLQVTEQLLNEKEALHKTAEQKFDSKIKLLEGEVATLTDTVKQLEGKLRMEEGEKEKLRALRKQLEKSVTEYEVLVKEKEDGILHLAEGKREAIKQLCIWIDYHSERCDYFKDMITKMRPVRGAQRGA